MQGHTHSRRPRLDSGRVSRRPSPRGQALRGLHPCHPVGYYLHGLRQESFGYTPYLPINPAGLFFAGLGGPVGEDDSLEDEKLQDQVENNQTSDDVPPVPLEPSSTRFFVL